MLSHTYISDRQRGKGHRRNDALPRLFLQLSDYLIKNTAIAQANTGIGTNRIEDHLREPNCPFVLFVGTKKMIKRKEFEESLSNAFFL
ncbi:MAG: hypothetical protein IJO72_05820 [Oscillospiraceae bacterium]|nr:hypothetical protein [Oscillospiraceae bacterium]